MGLQVYIRIVMDFEISILFDSISCYTLTAGYGLVLLGKFFFRKHTLSWVLRTIKAW